MVSATLERVRRMNQSKILCVLAIAAWLPYASELSPLPPAQNATLVTKFKEQLANPPSSSPDWAARPESERRFVEENYPEVERKLREFIDEADEFEVVLWVQWTGRVGILVFGIAAWTLLFLKNSRWWIAVLASTVVLWLAQAIFDTATYSHFFGAWSEGYSGLKFLPWSMAAWALYLDFLLPLLLAGFTLPVVLTRATRSNHVIQETSL